MGSRYGRLKQLDAIGAHGETLLDYSVYDAVRAGFSEVVFVIRREIEELFRSKIGDRYEKAFPHLAIKYAFQEMNDLAEESSFFSERMKPWGTGHALLAARRLIKSPFAVINADDYYGSSGYQTLAHFLKQAEADSWAMIGYRLKKTLSEHGTVSRGICSYGAVNARSLTEKEEKNEKRASDESKILTSITERTSISERNGKIIAEEKEGSRLVLTGEELVSLNFWALTPDIFSHLEQQFCEFLLALEQGDKKMQSAAEFYLPAAISRCIKEKRASVRLLPTHDAWFGLTHPNDLHHVKMLLSKMIDEGKYPTPLF